MCRSELHGVRPTSDIESLPVGTLNTLKAQLVADLERIDKVRERERAAGQANWPRGASWCGGEGQDGGSGGEDRGGIDEVDNGLVTGEVDLQGEGEGGTCCGEETGITKLDDVSGMSGGRRLN